MRETPKMNAFASTPPKEFSKRACNAHTHSNPMIHTKVRPILGMSSGVICNTTHEYTRPAPVAPKIIHSPVALRKFARNALK